MPSEQETNPYTAPQFAPSAAVPARRKATKLAKTGARLQLLPTLGNIAAAMGMARAISTFTSELVWDPAKLMVETGGVLMWMALGILGGMVGCLLLGLAVVVQRSQPRWVKVALGISVLVALQGSFVLVMMVGSVLGGAS